MERVFYWSNIHKVEKDKQPDDKKLKGDLLLEVQTTTSELKKYKQIMNKNQQTILQWLLQHKLRPDSVSENPLQAKLLELCSSQSEVWIQQVNAALDSYLTNKAAIKQLGEDLVIFGGAADSSDSNQVVSSSLLSVIKDFIAMLNP